MVSFRMRHAFVDVLRRVRENEGQALVEYSLLVSLIAVVAFVSVETFGLDVVRLYSHIVSVYP